MHECGHGFRAVRKLDLDLVEITESRGGRDKHLTVEKNDAHRFGGRQLAVDGGDPKIGIGEGRNIGRVVVARAGNQNEQKTRDEHDAGDERETDQTPSATSNVDDGLLALDRRGVTNFGGMAPLPFVRRLRGYRVFAIGAGSELVVDPHKRERIVKIGVRVDAGGR